MRSTVLGAALLAAVLPLAACGGEPGGGAPSETGLRDSFAQQVQSNRFIREFQRNGDDLLFSGPDGAGGSAKWRIHIDAAFVTPYPDAKQPYKGTINSSWYANDRVIRPGGRESNLPIELLDKGVSQDCWAFWDPDARSWDWE